ncbi:FAD-linked oxidase [Pseudorhizobium endolithicum]|uniref:FAD-linked oxidase n=1 Tax=Pseudorhizobium endolithicum TaxID=1191678 RepID=A0ABN7JFR4_9HYPH|nr:FAD-binding oxidoreductase [Pseudorhizobium endolithicum]CAD7026963.1 FAD-linked oxidase [Pseudorhizobium endolithicum]
MTLTQPAVPTRQELHRHLSALHPDLGVLSDRDLAGRHPGEHADNFGAGVMAQPATTEAAAALVSWCRAHDVPIVPQGGRTGLVGGNISQTGEVILSAGRLNRIRSIEPEEMTATVEAGVTLEALQQAAAEHGLTTGIDLGSRGSATIGGMVSTNAGGILAFRNGVMRHQVLGLEAVLPSGEIFSDLTRMVKVSAGPDLKQLFIGGEGAFGFVTKIVVKLEPQRPHRATALMGVADAMTALAVIRRLRALPGVTLEAAEMMWPRYIRDHARLKGLDLSWLEEDAAALLIEISGESVDVAAAALEEQLSELWEPLGLRGGIVAQSLDQARRFWDVREDSGFYYAEIPDAASFDVSVPPTYLDSYVAQLEKRLKAIDPTYAAYVYGHIADGNLHLTLIKRGPLPEQELRALEDAVYTGIREAGGSFSAEHGVGREKRYGYETFTSPEKQALARTLKNALDPKGLFNPGKVPF